MFKRKIYDDLLKWKEQSKGKTALLVEGPRRVGKSTVVEAFAAKEYRSYILVDFLDAPPVIRQLFDDISDLNYVFTQLQLQYGVRLFERESLIVFDEVQLCPPARQAIKKLVLDGRYDYIETGSLISIRKNTADILVPSEERKLQMYPMDYEEFCWAQGTQDSQTILRQVFESHTPLGDSMNRQLMRNYRLYMLVGGMPQAVDAYLSSNNLELVDQVKRDILSLYNDDFYKISPSGTLSRLFEAIPAQLAKKASRYHVSSVLANKSASDVLEEVSELAASKTVLVAYHADDPNVGMSASINLEKFKLYLADTGLFVTLMFKDSAFAENVVYEKLLADRLPVNLGAVYENTVAQTLAAKGDSLFYHTWLNEQSKRNYEIDFIVSRRQKICPIEVKSSRYKQHASLDKFAIKYAARIDRQYLIHTKDVRKDGSIYCLPTYMTQFI